MVCAPGCGVECSGHVKYPAFVPITQFLLQLFRNGSLFFVLFVSFGLEFAPTAHAQLF